MPTIKELKEDLQFNAELVDLLDVMKNTAVFQFRALQAKKERFEKFFGAIRDFFLLIGGHGNAHPLMAPQVKRRAMIMVTSDEGFMGSLNSQVISSASLQDGFEEAELIIIGERGARLLKEMGKDSVPFKAAVNAADRRTLAETLGDYIIKGIREGRFGKTAVLYPKPISFMLQRVEIAEILPVIASPEGASSLRGTESAEAISKSRLLRRTAVRPYPPRNDDGVAMTALNPQTRTPANSLTRSPADQEPLIIESPIEGIIDYLAEEMVKNRLVGIFEDSKLSEFAARAIHLENSSQQLTEKKRKLKFQYFKAYHEMIDKSTRELFSSQIIIHGKS